jgi:hypothetical protein
MVNYTDEDVNHVINTAVDQVEQRLDDKIDQAVDRIDQKLDVKIEQAIERVVGFYYEKTKHDIDLVLEATGFIRTRLDDMVTRDEFNELATEVGVIRHAVTTTNTDLRKLEKTVLHA